MNPPSRSMNSFAEESGFGPEDVAGREGGVETAEEEAPSRES